VVGVVLAGGLGRRLGGRDKPLVEVAGRPLIGHVLDRLRAAACAAVVINANGDGRRFAAWGLPVAADVLPGTPGPMAGLLTGLEWAATHWPEATHVLTVPADTPMVPVNLLDRLAAALGAGAEVACAASGGRRHPVIALWPVALRAAVRQAVATAEGRRIGTFAAGCRLAVVDWPVAPVDPFFNINRPEDLAAAERLLAGATASGVQPRP
jgi:molybdopterin-guanine dinucleotide biosynthesis protein A